MGYGQGRGGGGRKQYDNNMRGALFTNNDKRNGKKDPDMRGQMEVDGVEYWVDAWWNESKAGDEYLSFRVNPKDDGFEQRGQRGRNNGGSRGGNAGRSGGGDRGSDRPRGASDGRGRSQNDRGGPEDMDEDIPY